MKTDFLVLSKTSTDPCCVIHQHLNDITNFSSFLNTSWKCEVWGTYHGWTLEDPVWTRFELNLSQTVFISCGSKEQSSSSILEEFTTLAFSHIPGSYLVAVLISSGGRRTRSPSETHTCPDTRHRDCSAGLPLKQSDDTSPHSSDPQLHDSLSAGNTHPWPFYILTSLARTCVNSRSIQWKEESTNLKTLSRVKG